ncbi:MFS transporter [Nitrospira sp. BLG_1]|uniref:MFS transporter n=1 Tax=Nitrospira sp. BLG_1 TaxID=3395883 RepID=UPI0039BCE3CC
MTFDGGIPITTAVPQRLDRLPWSRWHWRIVWALGVTWLLDGLEVSIVAALGPMLTHPNTLHLTRSEVGLTASAYLTGSVVGALLFSYLTDRQGRKKWFMITLALYLSATVLTALSWDLMSFMVFRFLTGAGIGGEYVAINSAIDELIPARNRGHTDLAINGTWWLGSAAGALLTLLLLDPAIFPESVGWRLCFVFGAVLGVAIIIVRRVIPESPRWLMTHGRVPEAEVIVSQIEQQVVRDRGTALREPHGTMTVHPRPHATIMTVARELFQSYPRRTALGIGLMVTQSFMYNAISFTYPLLLTTYYAVTSSDVGLYLLPFAVGNFLGPLLLGRLFDTVGRKVMISFTYGIAGVLLSVTGYLFWLNTLTLSTQMLLWSLMFFFASAGASAAYLTVSEIFPMEIRAMAIAFFFIVAQGAGIAAPWIYGMMIETSAASVFYGYLLGGGMMLLGAVLELWLGVKAERQPLEHLAPPLSARTPGSV